MLGTLADFRQPHSCSADKPARDSTPRQLVRQRTERFLEYWGKSGPHQGASHRLAKTVRNSKSVALFIPAESITSARDRFSPERLVKAKKSIGCWIVSDGR